MSINRSPDPQQLASFPARGVVRLEGQPPVDARVLKPGGWFRAVTPNKWGYHAIGARLIPNSWHVPLLKFFSPHRKVADTFPTGYRMYTITDLKRLFPEDRFLHASFTLKQPPGYHANRMWLARIWILYDWPIPRAASVSADIHPEEEVIARAGAGDGLTMASATLSRARSGAAPVWRQAGSQAESRRDRAARRLSPS
jgi:hypothetical protein